MSNSTIVLARKLTLKNDNAIKPSHSHWKNKIEGMYTRGKLVPYLRHMVEMVNDLSEGVQPKHQYYEVDEESTKKFLKDREANKLKALETKQVESVGVAGLADIIGKALNKSAESVKQPEPVKVVEEVKEVEETEEVATSTDYSKWTIEELRSYCDSLDIEYHHMNKEPKLIELIKENK